MNRNSEATHVLLGDEVAELVVAGGLVPKLLVGKTDAVERIVVKSLAGLRSRHALVEGVVGGVAVGGGNLEIVGDVPREAEVAEETLRSVVRVRVLRRREERVVRLTSIPCLAVVRTHCGVDVDVLAGALVIRVVPRKLIVAAEAVTGDRL